MADRRTKLPIKSDKKTSVTSSSPRSTFENLRQEVDRIFDDFSPSSWRLPFGRSIFGLEVPHPAAWWIAPATDMVEKDKEYEISAELPGMDEKDIEIKLSNHTLSIKGEKSEEKEESAKRTIIFLNDAMDPFTASSSCLKGWIRTRSRQVFPKACSS